MTITANIEIACPPEFVRAKFLEFPSIPTYHTTFFTSITPQGPLESQQKITVVFVGMGKMDATILANEPQLFKWAGSIPLLFGGDHSFHFTPSTTTPGGTTFTQDESFYGALGFLMGDGFIARRMGMGEKTARNWEGFNKDFKAWCEKSG
ncbi:hypothetical protein HBH56_060920 [Parastagonospora nodorum]|uniref:Uncharacterized protein n=2 Tax=Phaeosphaeria nodorum (strain SN15 / ATCC MYA-4574 / FGSC 10173) TaxID=321614 RepID=A0A7U2ES07_PHANO|nr:hypothetical protein SNOG_02103 [Parastagonospora nodorum SN15]KAH3916611.1 hypothetical protein HBH56_060920 [Parastagonospora nodorum]EAT90315.1 hypothetical protein SNOG_02103 [Parastagonospora nodorum SN15]KAH3930676.1 hypothetical protein HBH54_104850 [Parastagonospora nodorum]KAH3968258.1 hypothetical protein HBH51_133940 [Parastagonospora nodorum]KAH4074105.1 hypothetical protein HBH50_042640 [Parastagonospora nodorum]